MKQLLSFFIFYFLLFNSSSFAQSIGIGTDTPNQSALLDISAANKGLLIPRTSTVSRNGIFQPAKGLMVYDTTTNSVWFHNGSAWTEIPPGKAWGLNGNAGSAPASNFLGTTDNQPLRFRLNNKWFGELNSIYRNILLGDSAGARLQSGLSGNIAIGSGALRMHQFATGIVAIGDSALTNADQNGTSNIAVGSHALYANTNGQSNLAIGFNALTLNTTGSRNTVLGNFTSTKATLNTDNTVVGTGAVRVAQSLTENVVIGSNAMSNTTFSAGAVALGYNSMGFVYQGVYDVSIGYNAMYQASGGDNVAIGAFTLMNMNGYNNIAVGRESLKNIASGSGNIVIGDYAASNITAGDYNTLIGHSATIGQSLTNAVAIGADAYVGCSNCLVLGGSAASTRTKVGINTSTPLTDLHIIQQSDAGTDKTRGVRLQRSSNNNQWRTFIDPNNNYIFEYNNSLYSYIEPVGGAFVNPSDARLKKDILPLKTVLDKIMLLQPKTYHYINNESSSRLYGFLAQEVETVFPEFVVTGQDGYKGIAYSNFSVLSIRAIQELNEKNMQQEKLINELKTKLDEVFKRLEKLESKN